MRRNIKTKVELHECRLAVDGCRSVARAIASDASGLQFEFNHGKKFNEHVYS